MNIFDPQIDWKFHIPERNIFIMKDHSWAFAVWESERLKGTIMPDAVLLHVDDHLDDVPDGLYVDGILSANTEEEFLNITRTNKELHSGETLEPKIRIDNFIWPSFARGTLGTMFTVAPQDMPDFASVVLKEHSLRERSDGYVNMQEILSFIPLEKFQKVHRTYSFEDFKQYSLEEFKLQTIDKSKILDLDLDYFVPGEQNFKIIIDDNQIKETMKEILNICEWDLITVALSPEYCGDEENTRHLLNLFCEVSGVDNLNI